MIAATRVPVLFTHHFRTIDPATGHLIAAIADEQAEQVRRLVAEAGQPFEYRSFPEQPHAMHQADPSLYAATVVEWAASVLAEISQEETSGNR
jgi:acyl-CoA reductase-like NAD-dependent aldehyde dehydrogenase